MCKSVNDEGNLARESPLRQDSSVHKVTVLAHYYCGLKEGIDDACQALDRASAGVAEPSPWEIENLSLYELDLPRYPQWVKEDDG